MKPQEAYTFYVLVSNKAIGKRKSPLGTPYEGEGEVQKGERTWNQGWYRSIQREGYM